MLTGSRLLGACVVGAALLVAGCSSGGGKSSTPTTTSAPLRAASVAAVCTNADLSRTGLVPMPHPIVLAHSRSFEGGQKRLAPPPAAAHPSVSPSFVWSASKAVKSPVGTYELVLASYSSPDPSTGGSPKFRPVLAWVIIGHHVPFVGNEQPPGAGTNGRPPCLFATVLEPFDAKTGVELALAEGTL
jgi:hypothetical protein